MNVQITARHVVKKKSYENKNTTQNETNGWEKSAQEPSGSGWKTSLLKGQICHHTLWDTTDLHPVWLVWLWALTRITSLWQFLLPCPSDTQVYKILIVTRQGNLMLWSNPVMAQHSILNRNWDKVWHYKTLWRSEDQYFFKCYPSIKSQS